MPADFNTPVVATAHATYLTNLKDRDISAITLCKDDPSNIPTYAKKYERALNKFQEWDGAAWVDLVLGIAGGGTGASTAAGSRTALGLGTIAVQDANAVAITGGTIAGVAANANIITAGLIAQARLGTGSGGAGLKFLADDQTYKDGVPVGLGFVWFTDTPPSGYLICDGSSVLRATYPALFAIIGTLYGSVDGTHFNLPDLRQRFPLGKAASGTGNTIAVSGGLIDHTHTPGTHTHSTPAHTHTVSAHQHSIASDGTHNHLGGVNTGPDTVTQVTVNGFLVFVASSTHGHGIASDGAHSHGAITGASSAFSTPGGEGSGTTGAPSAANTGSNNPPYLVINYVIKY